MLARVIVKSLKIRRRHLAIAAVAVLLATTLVAALFTLSLETGSKAGRELEAYGPNLLLMPKVLSLPAGTGKLGFGNVGTEGYIPAQSLSFLDSGQLKELRAYAPYLYAIAAWQGQKVVVAGTSFDKVRQLFPYWQVEGDSASWLPGVNPSIIGRNVAERFGLRPGDKFHLQFEQNSADFMVTGIAEVGGSEDNQVFIDLTTAQELASRSGQIDLVQLRVSADSLSAIATQLESGIPGVEARIIGQIAEAEAKVLTRIQLMMGLLTIAVLLAAALTVFSTLTASVLERRKEVGLMKALGAKNKQIMLIFLAEAWVIGILAGAVGIALGLGLAQVIGEMVFDTLFSFRPVVIPAVLAVALLVTTLASLLPVRNALIVKPIVALRSE